MSDLKKKKRKKKLTKESDPEGFAKLCVERGKASTKFRPWMAIDMYRMARAGLDQQAIADKLCISGPLMSIWKRKRHSVRYALEKGAEDRGLRDMGSETVDNFVDFVYGHLKPETRKTWDEIKFWEHDADAIDRTEALLKDKGERVRQELFIHALVDSGFDLSKALRLAAVPKQVYNRWMTTTSFNELMDELMWHKKNFIEGALLDLVKQRNPQAVIFANKTQNADRGYGDKTTVEHTGTVTHRHELVPVDELSLPLETRKIILDAMRQRNERLKLEEKKVIDVQAIPVKVSDGA